MLQHVKIENFIRVAYADFDVTRPVLFIAGHNEAGKSSIAEAVRFVLMADNPRVSLKKELPDLVTLGAKRGAVELTFDNRAVRRNIKDGKATGDTEALPSDGVALSICLQASRFADLAPTERRNLVTHLVGLEITPEKIVAELKRRKFDAKLIEKYEPLFHGGLEAAFDKAVRLERETRGAWQEVTGEKYGSVKAETWAPEPPAMSLEDLNKTLADTQTERSQLLAARDEELKPVLQKIAQYEEQMRGPKTLPCPSCGSALVYENGSLSEYEGDSGSDQQARARVLVQTQAMKRTEVNQKYADKIADQEASARMLQRQINDAEGLEHKAQRAATLHAEIQAAADMKALFGDGADGIQARFVAQAIEPFNKRLAEIAEEIGWQPVMVGGDMTIRRADQCVYPLLSESAQWRADAMLQVVIAEYARCRWIIMDRMDVLAPPDRPRFLIWISQYGLSNDYESTTLVFATLKERPNLESLPGIQAHWVEAGEIEIEEE